MKTIKDLDHLIYLQKHTPDMRLTSEEEYTLELLEDWKADIIERDKVIKGFCDRMRKWYNFEDKVLEVNFLTELKRLEGEK